LKKVILYQLAFLVAICTVWAQGPLGNFPEWIKGFEPAINCIIVSALAGVLYCLRAIYVNYSAHKNWDSYWELWYYLRPVTSAISGLVAYIFLKASIIILEASPSEGSVNFGYLACAFIAGYNVDNFLRKIESLAKSTFGVEKTKTAKSNEDDN